MDQLVYDMIALLIMILGTAGFVINITKLFAYNNQEGNSIVGCAAVTNIVLITLCFPLIISAYLNNGWLWGNIGCSFYGFFTLFLGFIQMHLPIMAIIDSFYQHTDENYEINKKSKRMNLIYFSVTCSFLLGAAPLIGWSKMDFEPSKLSCSVYENKPGTGYISYLIVTAFFFELLPLISVIYCKIKGQYESKESCKHLLLCGSLLVSWTPYTIVYFWPLFSDVNNLPLWLSAVAPLFAKIAVISVPILVDM